MKVPRPLRQEDDGITFLEISKPSNRWQQRKSLYGMSEDDYWAFYRDCRGRCPVCAVSFEDDPAGMTVDHDAKTRVIRGLICQYCNIAIGALDHSPSVARAAAKYLETPPKRVMYAPK